MLIHNGMNQISKLIKIPVGLFLIAVFASACSGQGIGLDAGLILGGQGSMVSEFSGATDTDSDEEFYDDADFSESADVSGSEFDVINMDGDVVELDAIDSDLAVADYSDDEILGWDNSESVDVDDEDSLESAAPQSDGSATDEFDKSHDDENESEYNDETGPFSLPVSPAKEDDTDEEAQNESNKNCEPTEEGDIMLAMLENEAEDLSLRRSRRSAGRGRFSTGDAILHTRNVDQADDVEVVLVKCEEIEDEDGGRHFEWTAQKEHSTQSIDVVAEFDTDDVLLRRTHRGSYVIDSKFIGDNDVFTTRAIDKRSGATVSNNVVYSDTIRSTQRLFETVRIK